MSEVSISGKELLDVDQVSERLKVGRVTIYRWCREGRLPCMKVGKSWRIREEALEDFLQRSEVPKSLADQLRPFVRVPDSILGIAPTRETLHRLDTAFYKVAESRGGLMVKCHAGEPELGEEGLRDEFERHGFEVRRLEQEGRFRFSEERDPASGREEALETLIAEKSNAGRTIWAAFNWTAQVDIQTALRQQEALGELADRRQLVVKTAVLEEVSNEWSREAWHWAHTVHSGVIRIYEDQISFDRLAILPPE